MAKKRNIRKSGIGYLEQRGDIWLARWTVNGKRFTRSTGEKISDGKKAREAAERKLEEFTQGFTLKGETEILQYQMAKLAGVNKDLAESEESKPALKFLEAWAVYLKSQSRPRSGRATLESYESQYFLFVKWLSFRYPEIKELREVTRSIAEEYAQALLNGTTKEEISKREKARKWLADFDKRRSEQENPPELSDAEQEAIENRRKVASIPIRRPVSGNTFNKNMNALALVWRFVAKDERAKIKENIWAYNEETGEGIRRVVLKHEERPRTRRPFTVEQVYKLLHTATGELRVLIAVGFYTGFRLGDAINLKWETIDRVTGTINIRSNKTDIETRTAIHPALAKILQAEAEPKSSGYVMPELSEIYNRGNAGETIIQGKLRRLFKSVEIEINHKEENGRRAVSDYGFHSLRHTFTTILRNSGATLQEAKQLAGHATERMTEHYTHEDGRATLLLPDISETQTEEKNTTPTTATPSAPPPDIIEALKQLTEEQRAAIIKALANK